MSTSYLERYLDGDRPRVWAELRALGPQVREPSLREQAEAVVREAMTRASRNVTTLIERLRGQGYRFGDQFSEESASQPHAPPDGHTAAFVAWLEKRWGPLPLTARLWIEVVGDVNLLGVHPAWPARAISDPLVVEFEHKTHPWAQGDRTSVREFFAGEHEAWEDEMADWADEPDQQEPFALDVSPDALHKANFSGGAPYGIFVPDPSIDGTFRFDDGVRMPFIDYLSLAFEWGGFPGFHRRPVEEGGAAALRELARDLLPL